MCTYADKLKDYLDQNPIGYTDGDSLLEQLYWCYGEANSFDITETREQFQKLRCCMPEITEDRFDEIFSIFSTLSILQEKHAFQVGIKIGLRLATEVLNGDAVAKQA